MYYEAISDYQPIVIDIVMSYQKNRRMGMDRTAALRQLREEFSAELSDFDDGPAAVLGIALALCQKKELTEPCRDDALRAIDRLLTEEAWGEAGSRLLLRTKKILCMDTMLGPEAVYRQRRFFDPEWNVGDTFAHRLSDRMGETEGLPGWYILIRKVGQTRNREGVLRHQALLTLCPADRLPQTNEEINALGCLRMYAVLDRSSKRWVFRSAFEFPSQKKFDALELVKTGCFPEIWTPENYETDDDFLFSGYLCTTEEFPHDLESNVCFYFRFSGIQLPDGSVIKNTANINQGTVPMSLSQELSPKIVCKNAKKHVTNA